MARIVTPIDVDPEALFQQFVESMQARVPGWEPADGSPDVWIAEGFAQIGAQIAESAADVTTQIFRWYGANVAGVPPIDAVPATSSVTITAVDGAGYTVPAGFELALASGDGSLIGFTTTEDAVIAPGVTTDAVGIIAIEAGANGNDLVGDVTQVDSLAYVDNVELVAPTAGGSDAEEDDDYLLRLIAEEQLRTVSPILPRDFAQLSKRAIEVARTAYLDGYNPADGTFGNDLHITLVPITEDGSNVSASTVTALITQFGEDGATPAIINFEVHIANPHRTAVDVAFSFETADGFDPASVKLAAEDALAAFFDPAMWGQPLIGELRKFDVVPLVRRGAVFRVLYDVPGLFDVTSLTIEGSSTADYTLPTTNAEPVPLATPGTIVGTPV